MNTKLNICIIEARVAPVMVSFVLVGLAVITYNRGQSPEQFGGRPLNAFKCGP